MTQSNNFRDRLFRAEGTVAEKLLELRDAGVVAHNAANSFIKKNKARLDTILATYNIGPSENVWGGVFFIEKRNDDKTEEDINLISALSTLPKVTYGDFWKVISKDGTSVNFFQAHYRDVVLVRVTEYGDQCFIPAEGMVEINEDEFLKTRKRPEPNPYHH